MSLEAYFDAYAVQVATYCNLINQAFTKREREAISSACRSFLIPKVIQSLNTRLELFTRLGHESHPSMGITRKIIDIYNICYSTCQLSDEHRQFLDETNNVALVIALIVID